MQWRYSRPRESQLAPWTQGNGGNSHGVPDLFFLAASLKPLESPNLHKDYWILYEIHSFGSRKVFVLGSFCWDNLVFWNLMIGEGYLIYAGWFNSRPFLSLIVGGHRQSLKRSTIPKRSRIESPDWWWLIHSLGSRHFPPYDLKWHTCASWNIPRHVSSRVWREVDLHDATTKTRPRLIVNYSHGLSTYPPSKGTPLRNTGLIRLY